MKPLETNQRVLRWFCILPSHEPASKWQKIVYITLTPTTIIAMVSIVTASAFFLLKYISIDLEMALYALFQISTCGSLLYACVVVFYSKHRIPIVFDHLADIYHSSEKIGFFFFVWINQLILTFSSLEFHKNKFFLFSRIKVSSLNLQTKPTLRIAFWCEYRNCVNGYGKCTFYTFYAPTCFH